MGTCKDFPYQRVQRGMENPWYMVQKFLNLDPKIFRLDKESLINEIKLEKKSVVVKP